MSYDNPQREQYSIVAASFGAGTVSKQFQGPPGKVGVVRDIRVYLSAAAVGTTAVPEVDVGSAVSDSSYARFLLGTTAIAGYAAGEYRARSLVQNAPGRTGSFPPQLTDFANHICLEGNNASVPSGGSCSAAVPAANLVQVAGNAQANVVTRIPADTPFFITGKQGIGGTPAGAGDIDVIIDWY